MIAALGMLAGIVLGIVFQPNIPHGLEPYLPIAVVAALAAEDGVQGGVGEQLSTGVVVVLGIRIFSNVAAIRRHLFHA